MEFKGANLCFSFIVFSSQLPTSVGTIVSKAWLLKLLNQTRQWTSKRRVRNTINSSTNVLRKRPERHYYIADAAFSVLLLPM